MKLRSVMKTVRHQAGVTILEFIAFIGLAALVIAGALALYQTANTGSAAKEILEVSNGMVATLRSTAAARGTKAGDIGIDTITLPTGWTSSTRAITKTAGGYKITYADSSTAGNMKIEISGLSAELSKNLVGAKIGSVVCKPGAGLVSCDPIPY